MKRGSITVSQSKRGTTIRATGRAAHGLFTALARQAAVDVDNPATCIACGCTDCKACPGGCWWLEVDRTNKLGVCSSCQGSRAQWVERLALIAKGATK